MGKDPITGKNRKFTNHKDKVVEELTEEQILEAMSLSEKK